MLASYAVRKSRGREYSEPEDSFRNPFERDRHRILHSKAFRRLSGKTQVFVATFGDHYRDRLSHTLEVAQISRDIARRLHLNEDLVEAIALAHDLGHPPFAHAGEEELNRLMKKFHLHFEHNEQSKRIVELLEDRYPNFSGLNVTLEVREGLAKHQTHYDQRGRKISAKTLEAQVADLADEIAYHNHDLDDGFRSRLFTFEDLRTLCLWRKAEEEVRLRYGPEIPKKYHRYLTMSRSIGLMVEDVSKATLKRLHHHRIRSLQQVLRFPKSLCGFSPIFQKYVSELRKFLWKRMYRSPKVMRHSRRGQKIIRDLFSLFLRHPELLPQKLFFPQTSEAGSRLGSGSQEGGDGARHLPGHLAILVKDYIAGMTDQFASELHRKYC